MTPSTTARLLVACPDRPGIIAATTAFVAEHGGNVVDLQQHTDHSDEAFFQRVEFEVDDLDLGRAEVGPAFAAGGRAASRMRWVLGWSDSDPAGGAAGLEGAALRPRPAAPLAGG